MQNGGIIDLCPLVIAVNLIELVSIDWQYRSVCVAREKDNERRMEQELRYGSIPAEPNVVLLPISCKVKYLWGVLWGGKNLREFQRLITLFSPSKLARIHGLQPHRVTCRRFVVVYTTKL